MLAISIVNLILSIFGITVSSIFILFWCGRYFCARFFIRRMPGSRGLFFLGAAHNRGVAEHNSVGVSPLVIAYFPTITFHQDTFLPRHDAMCAVCLGEYTEEELLRMLPQCGHNFHANCIDAWLQRHATCPVCRMSLQGYFVGRRFQPTPQAMGPATDHVVLGLDSNVLSGHLDLVSAGLPPSEPCEMVGTGNPTVLSVSSSQSSSGPGPCERPQAQTARLDEHRVLGSATHSVERG